jgi:hypothetical protein
MFRIATKSKKSIQNLVNSKNNGLSSQLNKSLSSKSSPPTPPPVTPKPTIHSNANKSSDGGGGFLFGIGLALFGVSYLSYKLEEDIKLAASLESRIPFDLISYLDPIRSLIRKTGIIIDEPKLLPPIEEIDFEEPNPFQQENNEIEQSNSIKEEQEVKKKEEEKQQEEEDHINQEEYLISDKQKNEFENILNDALTLTEPPRIEENKPIENDTSTEESPLVVNNDIIQEEIVNDINETKEEDVVIEVESEPTKTISDVVTSEEVESYLPKVKSEYIANKSYNDSADNAVDQLTKQSVALRKELELTLLSDINELDADALRTRVVQLTAEFFERTKWEGIRLHQTLKQVENEITRRYMDLMQQQREELERESKAKLSLKEEEISKEFLKSSKESIDKQAKEFEEYLNKALDAQANILVEEMKEKMNHDFAVLREKHVKEKLETQETIQKLRTQLELFNNIVDKNHLKKSESRNIHQQSAVILALETKLSTSKPIENDIKNVKDVCYNDNLTMSILQTIPNDVYKSGVLTVPELKSRFHVVRAEVRKVSLAPESEFVPSIIGHFVGMFLIIIFI